jgi:hypothetical protein
MARKVIDIGAVGNDGTGDSIRDSFRKVNDNFRELYSSLGLGERLTFLGLSDAPITEENSYQGYERAFVTVNDLETGLSFRNFVQGPGITLDYNSIPGDILISSAFQTISADPNPQLGGNLSAQSGGDQYRIVDLDTPISSSEAVNKAYADSKVSLAGIDSIDPATGLKNESFGQMTGPLILSRDPEAEDDDVWGGLVAATKRYVDTSAFGSVVNLYVATSGQDDRPAISKSVQGRALAYAYRTIEGALKKAEEIMLESRIELGPYKKILTYNEGEGQCTLSAIEVSPGSGVGFSGQVLMSIDTLTINLSGTNYLPGDIITITGGTFVEPAQYEVLSTTAGSFGSVISLRQLTSGVYTALPGSSNVVVSSNSEFGQGLTVDLTYKVNSVNVLDSGSGYGLVSVRIVGGSGTGAFGIADIVGGSVQSITITDQGSGFTTLPNVVVNLPRFLIDTQGFRTDFTGDVTTQTLEAARTRDIREGLYLRGETSGALAQILAHDGSLIGDDEFFDVDIQFGNFVEGEVISYGDAAKRAQTTILVESGIYEENLPLKVPQNVSIVGDEFRRVIIRPKQGISSSPWSFINFRRDPVIDGMDVVGNEYGYHYLSDPTSPVRSAVNNKGNFRAAPGLISLNRQFVQKETIAWIDQQKSLSVTPFSPSFTYDKIQYEKDIGQLIDSMVFDLKYGGSARTVSDGLKYFDIDSSRVDLSSQLTQFSAVIEKVETLIQTVVKNQTIVDPVQEIYQQIVDNAFIAEAGTDSSEFSISASSQTDPVVVTTTAPHRLINGELVTINNVNGMTELNGNSYYVSIVSNTEFAIYSNPGLTTSVDGTAFSEYVDEGDGVNQGGVVGSLFSAFTDVITESASINVPKLNTDMDMFLCNDSVRFQAVTMQGQGGFAMVLDPTGQVLAKSPYAQECSSFSRSTGRQTFAGGMFIDGFAGNLKFKMLSKDSDTFLRVGELHRFPQLPASFIVEDIVYRINYVRDFSFNVEGSTASFILDETTPWPFDLIEYDETIFEEEVGSIINGLSYDIVFGSNFHARKSGLLYRQPNASDVISDRLSLTVDGVARAHQLAESVVATSEIAVETVRDSNTEIEKILRNGTVFASNLVIPSPTGLSTDLDNAKNLILNNISYIVNESIAWTDYQIANNLSPFTTSFTYDFVKYSNNVQFIVEAVAYDLVYGGNSESRGAALQYWNGAGELVELQLDPSETTEFIAVINYAKFLSSQVIRNLGDPTPPAPYSSTPRVTGTPSTLAIAIDADALISLVPTVITSGPGAAPAEVLPDLDGFSYNSTLKTLSASLLGEKINIQQETMFYVESIVNVYEVLMPGNRSMLANDFTQINDLGYGILATNGGLCEAVSVFTYYNYTSYYSINGGQIRSVSGSSAHGVYALVSEGGDPLENPRDITLFHDLSQGVECYAPSAFYANSQGGVVIFVTNYVYVPLRNSELEIDHGLGSIYRYPVVGVSTDTLPPGVARLTIQTSDGAGVDGLANIVADGTKMTVRMNSSIVLTGDVVGVSTRPSTALIFEELDEVYRVLQFNSYDDPAGYQAISIIIGNPTTIVKSSHGLRPDYQIKFGTTISLPTGIVEGDTYYILPEGFTNDSFRISTTRRGVPLATSGIQDGVQSFIVTGLAETVLRENYNYIDMSVWTQQPFVTDSRECTISIGTPSQVTLTNHLFSEGDVIRFETTDELPFPLIPGRHYWVESVLTSATFTITDTPDGSAIETSGVQSGTHSVGLVVGRAGDDEFAIVPLGPQDAERVIGSKLVWIGEEYTVVNYQDSGETSEDYGLLTLNRNLIDSVINYTGLPTLKSGALKAQPGTITVRISLTRVTSHDLLDIGTGGYADTNYPSEIYGSPVNPYNQANETIERSVGRVFYVTTDQNGNFNVGPFFRVDQGTGTVTFAASIALTNLDGIGFKRGVPISEFSPDPTFSDNATDAVPTENATRIYLERRLGLTHGGDPVGVEALIPPDTGGFLALNGLLGMKANLNLNNHKILNVLDPVNLTDGVNLQSLTFDNFQDISLSSVSPADLLAFTGTGDSAENYTVTGDITLTVSPTPNTISSQITAGVIVNTDINASAAIAQSKLSLNSATTRLNATGITQANLGLSSFNSAQFNTTSGWVDIKDNSVVLGKLEQIASKRLLGNSSLISDNVSTVTYADVVSEGGAIKKSQFSSGTGFIKRITSTFNSDGDYSIVDDSTDNDANTLVRRDSNGDFSSRRIDIQRLLIDGKIALDTTTSPTGGYTVLYGFLNQTAIQIGDGTQTTDKVTFYDNNKHQFRTQAGSALGSVVMGDLTATTVSTPSITTGGATTDGSLTGKWSLLSTSSLTFNTGNLTMGTGILDVTTGTLKSRTLTTGNTATTGTVTGLWSLTTGSRFEATYADLAEYYEGDQDYAVGTVLIFGGDREVTLAKRANDHRVAGVVSENAAYTMNSGCPGIKVCIALQGRVPCRVVGKISKGDLMVTSNIAGVAISAKGQAMAGTMIGKALEKYDSDHIGTIEIAIGRA